MGGKIFVNSVNNQSNTSNETLILENSVYFFVYSFTGIVALFGNIIVVQVVFSFSKMQNFVHILLANMAVSDIICALSFFTGLILCSDLVITSKGNTYCVLNKGIQLLTFQVTSVTMIIIAVDRWLSVFYPFYHREIRSQNWRVVNTLIAIWIISVLIIILTSSSLGYQRYFNSNSMLIKCEVGNVVDIFGSGVLIERVQLITANLAHFWIPLSVISAAYGSITFKVWNRKVGNDVTESQMNLLILQKWKTIKMLIATVVVFVVCWLPFFIFNILAFKTDSSKKRPCTQSLNFLLVIWLAFSSCCYNPLVYWIYNETYRKGILLFIYAMKCKKYNPTSSTQIEPLTSRRGAT